MLYVYFDVSTVQCFVARVTTAMWLSIVFTLRGFSENKKAIFYWLSPEQYDAVCRDTIRRPNVIDFLLQQTNKSAIFIIAPSEQRRDVLLYMFRSTEMLNSFSFWSERVCIKQMRNHMTCDLRDNLKPEFHVNNERKCSSYLTVNTFLSR